MQAAMRFDFDQVIYEGGCIHLAIFAPYPMGEFSQRRIALVRLPHPDGNPSHFVYAKWDESDPTQPFRAV